MTRARSACGGPSRSPATSAARSWPTAAARAAPPPPARPARCAHERELSLECAGPPDPAMGPIMICGAPTSVRVTIAKDGALLADATLAPRYSNLRWDGFDCDPSCRAASATVEVR